MRYVSIFIRPKRIRWEYEWDWIVFTGSFSYASHRLFYRFTHLPIWSSVRFFFFHIILRQSDTHRATARKKGKWKKKRNPCREIICHRRVTVKLLSFSAFRLSCCWCVCALCYVFQHYMKCRATVLVHFFVRLLF